MKNVALVTLLVGSALLGRARPTVAQEIRGFVGGGMMADVNDQRFPAFGGGVLLDSPTEWVSAGAQGEMFVSWPYFAGRGAVFGQVNPVQRGPLRPFLMAGYGFGESGGLLVGAGLEVRSRDRRRGLRASVEDYFAQVQQYPFRAGARSIIGHQLTVRVGLVF